MTRAARELLRHNMRLMQKLCVIDFRRRRGFRFLRSRSRGTFSLGCSSAADEKAKRKCDSEDE